MGGMNIKSHVHIMNGRKIFIFFFIFCSPEFPDSKSAINNHISFIGTEIFTPKDINGLML
jgi:hypothetical protein